MKFRDLFLQSCALLFLMFVFNSFVSLAQNPPTKSSAAQGGGASVTAPSTPAAAKDKPALTDAEKIEILKQQRTVLDEEGRMRDAINQYNALIRQHADDSQALENLIDAANKKAGSGWQLKADTLDFVAVPPAPLPPPPAVKP